MIEERHVGNCEARVSLKLDPSEPRIKNALVAGTLVMHCKKIDGRVNLAGRNPLFGVPVNIICLHTGCPFNTNGVTRNVDTGNI